MKVKLFVKANDLTKLVNGETVSAYPYNLPNAISTEVTFNIHEIDISGPTDSPIFSTSYTYQVTRKV